jgi:hypothetical protein
MTRHATEHSTTAPGRFRKAPESPRHTFLFAPAFSRLTELVERGELGDLTCYDLRRTRAS